MMSIRSTFRAGLLLLAVISPIVHAAKLFNNGDFESSNLAPWSDKSVGEGSVKQISTTNCFAGLDIHSLSIRGEKVAVLSVAANTPLNANAILLSDAFTAGDGIAFIALAATVNEVEAGLHPSLKVEIVDAHNEKSIVKQMLIPNHARLEAGCTPQAMPVPGKTTQFSSHYFSTQAYSGQKIRIQFSLAADKHAAMSFVFIDQVVNFAQGEQPLFYSRPYAQAGLQKTSSGMPYLNAMGSFDPDQAPSALRYTWYINDRNFDGPKPCLTDLDQGNYHAVLYVNDSHYVISDDAWFFVAAPGDVFDDEQSECQMPPAQVSASKMHAEDASAMIEPSVAKKPPVIATMDSLESGLKTVPAPPIATISPAKTTGPASNSTPGTELTRKAYALNLSGVRWQPTATEGGRLRVITPGNFPQQTLLLLTAQGKLLETASLIKRTPQGFAYRFKQAGSTYPANSILRVGHTDYLVKNPANAM